MLKRLTIREHQSGQNIKKERGQRKRQKEENDKDKGNKNVDVSETKIWTKKKKLLGQSFKKNFLDFILKTEPPKSKK
jgi:hypothetical protein